MQHHGWHKSHYLTNFRLNYSFKMKCPARNISQPMTRVQLETHVELRLRSFWIEKDLRVLFKEYWTSEKLIIAQSERWKRQKCAKHICLNWSFVCVTRILFCQHRGSERWHLYLKKERKRKKYEETRKLICTNSN